MWAALLALAWLGPAAAEAEKRQDSIRAFVERVDEASTNFFSSGSEAEARERARTLLAWAFDIPAMAREALGFAWDTISEEERKQLLEAFEEDVVGAYLRRMRPKGTTLTFVGHRPPSDGNYLAASRRTVPGKKDQIWIWQMRPDGDSWRITDLVLNGRSAIGAQRQEYRSVLESNHGDMNVLIAFMRKRAAQ
jgi:phospholipid transport system substrate-binding protein